MTLPSLPLPRAKVEFDDGSFVEVRGLTRAEAARVQQAIEAGDQAEAEVAILAGGTDTPEPDVRAWYAATPAALVGRVVDEIAELTGLAPGSSKSGPQEDDAGGP